MRMILQLALAAVALGMLVFIVGIARSVRRFNLLGMLPPGRFSPESRRLLLRMRRRRRRGVDLPGWFLPCRLEHVHRFDDGRLFAFFGCGRPPIPFGLPVETDADIADLFRRVSGDRDRDERGLSPRYRIVMDALPDSPQPDW